MQDNSIKRIVMNDDIMGGVPCIAGTRIPVSAIRSFHDVGYTAEKIMEEYPTVTLVDIKAALEYPTGADNAQVQDAKAMAREIQRDYVDLWGDMPNRRSAELTDAIAQALREAERRGMMRAIEEIVAVEKDMEGHMGITARQNTFRYGAGYALGRAAREIERAAKEPK